MDYSRILLDQPAGSAIAGVVADGDRLFLTVTGGGQPDRVIVVDLARGQASATIGLGGTQPSPSDR